MTVAALELCVLSERLTIECVFGSVNLDATETGDVTFTFKSTGAFSCESSVVDGMNAITCKSS